MGVSWSQSAPFHAHVSPRKSSLELVPPNSITCFVAASYPIAPCTRAAGLEAGETFVHVAVAAAAPPAHGPALTSTVHATAARAVAVRQIRL